MQDYLTQRAVEAAASASTLPATAKETDHCPACDILESFEDTLRTAAVHLKLPEGSKASSEQVRHALVGCGQTALAHEWSTFRAGRRAVAHPSKSLEARVISALVESAAHADAVPTRHVSPAVDEPGPSGCDAIDNVKGKNAAAHLVLDAKENVKANIQHFEKAGNIKNVHTILPEAEKLHETVTHSIDNMKANIHMLEQQVKYANDNVANIQDNVNNYDGSIDNIKTNIHSLEQASSDAIHNVKVVQDKMMSFNDLPKLTAKIRSLEQNSSDVVDMVKVIQDKMASLADLPKIIDNVKAHIQESDEHSLDSMKANVDFLEMLAVGFIDHMKQIQHKADSDETCALPVVVESPSGASDIISGENRFKGRVGTVSQLLEAGLVSTGSLLQSVDNAVALSSCSGSSLLHTASPVVRVTRLCESGQITLTDAGCNPARDRAGRPVFGYCNSAALFHCLTHKH